MSDSRVILGQTQLKRGATSDAIKTLRRAVRASSKDGFAHLHLGLAYLYARQYGDALKALSTAHQLLPHQPFIVCATAMAHYDQGHWNQAGEALDLACKIDPDYGLPRWLMGLVAWAEGRLEDAREALLAAPLIHNGMLDGRLLARIEAQLMEHAPEQLPAEIALHGEASASPLRFRWVLGLSLALGGLIYPSQPARRKLRALEIRGNTALDQHRYGEAMEAYGKASKMVPGSALLRFRLAEAQLQGGDPQAALRTLDSIELGKEQVETRAEVDALRGTALCMAGRYDQALSKLEAAGNLPPPQIAYFRGLAALGAGQADRASRDLLQFAFVLPPKWLRERLLAAIG